MWAIEKEAMSASVSHPHPTRHHRHKSRRYKSRIFLGAALLLVASTTLPACEAEHLQPTIALFTMPGEADQDLYALPYPNDLRVTPQGTIDLARLSTGQLGLIQNYLNLVKANALGGFATNGAAFFRFSAPLNSRSLPATAEISREPGASVSWVNVDTKSPGYGERIPFTCKFTTAKGRYAGDNLLAILPVPGFVLRPKTRYAIILTRGVLDELDISVDPDRDFRPLLLEEKPAEARLHHGHTVYAALREYIAKENLTDVTSAAVFTTGQPTGIVTKARAVVYRHPVPKVDDLRVTAENTESYDLVGTYEAPNFQGGTPPYMNPKDGGVIALNIAGEPIVSRQETMRFALSVPRATMPKTGWPIVLYAHGTGGDYKTFLRAGVARNLASIEDGQGKIIEHMAVVGIDQVLHGPRAPTGTNVEIAFFNPMNPAASIHNVLQGAIDNFQLLRMIKALTFDDVPWREGSGVGGTIEFGATRFDPQRIYFMGHSQGSLTGPAFVAAEPEIKGAVLSGAGGGAMLSLIYKTKPIAIAPLFEAALHEPIGPYHPLLNLFQQMLEPADPNNYAPAFFFSPRPGQAAKPIFLSEGLIDHATPTATTESLATAMRAPPLGKVLQPVLGLSLRGLSEKNLPISGNVSTEGGSITAGLLQYRAQSKNTSCTDDKPCGSGYCEKGTCRREGHFVIFDNPEARRHYSSFLGTLARDGIATISP